MCFNSRVEALMQMIDDKKPFNRECLIDGLNGRVNIDITNSDKYLINEPLTAWIPRYDDIYNYLSKLASIPKEVKCDCLLIIEKYRFFLCSMIQQVRYHNAQFEEFILFSLQHPYQLDTNYTFNLKNLFLNSNFNYIFVMAFNHGEIFSTLEYKLYIPNSAALLNKIYHIFFDAYRVLCERLLAYKQLIQTLSTYIIYDSTNPHYVTKLFSFILNLKNFLADLSFNLTSSALTFMEHYTYHYNMIKKLEESY